MNTLKLLIIDDEENMRHMLKALLLRNNYHITLAADGVEATEQLQINSFDFILCDVRMPRMDGLEFLRCNKDSLKNSTVIMMSAYGSIDIALEAMKVGAYDFISKPFKSDEVLLALKKAEEREQLKRENTQLRETLQEFSYNRGFSNIIGGSRELEMVLKLAEKVAVFDTTVLITGESGTGKELIARGIHAGSSRKRKTFFAINCGSIPGELLESELFGHVKGSFTGADRNKKGLFEEASGSTLFLDEIGELPLMMQVKLLRVLQENEIRPVGSAISKKIDVRIIAATARDLEESVKLGKFREDLFYRLNVLPIHLPPLRNRIDDVPQLCHHFMKKYNAKLQKNISSISPDVMNIFMAYSWPGNVRELENIIQRTMVLTETYRIDVEHIPQALSAESVSEKGDKLEFEGFSLKVAHKHLEEKLIARALEKTGGNKSKAAILLEISYPSLLSKIKEYF